MKLNKSWQLARLWSGRSDKLVYEENWCREYVGDSQWMKNNLYIENKNKEENKIEKDDNNLRDEK